MRSLALVPAALAVALLAPAAAGAAGLPTPKPPSRAALAAADVKVSWPLSKPAVEADPGTTFTVRVHRGSAPATVSLVRIASSGKPMRTVARRKLRRGAFTVRLPQTAPATYALRLRAGGRTFFSLVSVPRPAQPPFPCAVEDPAQAAATLTFADGGPAQPVAPGTRVNVLVTNTGPTCIDETGTRLLRETAPGAWEAVQQRDARGNVLVYPASRGWLAPGAVSATAAFIPPDAAPGIYRVGVSLMFAGGARRAATFGALFTEPFTVAAP